MLHDFDNYGNRQNGLKVELLSPPLKLHWTADTLINSVPARKNNNECVSLSNFGTGARGSCDSDWIRGDP